MSHFEKSPHPSRGNFQDFNAPAFARVVIEFPLAPSDSQGTTPVKRLEVLDLFELGAALARMKSILERDKLPGFDIYFALSGLRSSLAKFCAEHRAFPLAFDSACDLGAQIDTDVKNIFLETVTPLKFKDNLNLSDEMNTWFFYQIKTKMPEFEHVFSAVCRKCETYFVEQKMGFDISLLLHHAEENLHVSVRPFMSSDAIEEIKAAGRCFALESYTASGFHTLRALEVVMGDYYKQVSGKEKEFRSWFDYVEAFQELEAEVNGVKPKFPSPKVSAMLDRMRQLDRNPLMHPRDTLDEMSADTLFKLGMITITELAKDMRDMAGQTELKLVTSNVAVAE
jgi:hypothetical protein